MKLSIVTIAYNSAATIETTIQSVAAQSFPEIEHVVVDGGSTDGTVEILERGNGGVDKFISEPDDGIYDALNKGIRLATGDVIGFLHTDDFFRDKGVVERIARAFGDDSVDAVYGDCVYVDSSDTDRVTRYWRTGNYRKGAFRRGWMPPHTTFFARRSCYERLGLYRTDFRSAGDYELMLRFIHKEEIRLRYIPEVLVVMREGGTSNRSLKNRVRANNEDRRAWTVNGLTPPFYTRYLKPLRKINQYWRRPPERKAERLKSPGVKR